MSEPSNPNTPWRAFILHGSGEAVDPYGDDIRRIKTTPEQRAWARQRLAQIDKLRQQQLKRSRKENRLSPAVSGRHTY